VAIAQGPGRRFVAAGGSHFKTARYLDNGAKLISALAINPPTDLLAAEGSPVRTASFIVDRGETLPVPTRVFFRISGIGAAGPIPPLGVPLPAAISPCKALLCLVRSRVASWPLPRPAPVAAARAADLPSVVIPPASIVTVTLTPVDDTQWSRRNSPLRHPAQRELPDKPLAHDVLVNIADNDSLHFNFQPARREGARIPSLTSGSRRSVPAAGD
jgi:hypothetical protein